jgi:hypothetical protein
MISQAIFPFWPFLCCGAHLNVYLGLLSSMVGLSALLDSQNGSAISVTHAPWPATPRSPAFPRIRPSHRAHKLLLSNFCLGSALGSIWVNLGSTMVQPGLNTGSTWGPHGDHLGSTWGQPGVNLGSTWGQPGVNLSPTWGQHRVNLGVCCCRLYWQEEYTRDNEEKIMRAFRAFDPEDKAGTEG